MNICTDKVTDWMIRCKVINESEKELYQYALYSAILQIIPLLLAGGIGFCFGSMRCGIIMILPFIILRKYSGGFHAKRLRLCLVGSSLLLFLCIFLCMRLVYRNILFFVTVVLAISLIQFSPIENNNRKLGLLEKKRYKKIIVISVTVFLITALILLWLNKDRYAICIFIGIQLTASLQIPCLFLKMKKDQKEP